MVKKMMKIGQIVDLKELAYRNKELFYSKYLDADGTESIRAYESYQYWKGAYETLNLVINGWRNWK